MQIKLINVLRKLQIRGIDPSIGSGIDTLTSQLGAIIPLQSWNYEYLEDALFVNIPDGTVIPVQMSDYGDVVT